MDQIRKKQEKKLAENIKKAKSRKDDYKNSLKGNSKAKKKKYSLFSKLLNLNKEENNVTTTQDTIPFDKMYRDGICKTDERHFNKSIKFNDINYRLAQTEDQQRIFNQYCELLNYFDSSIDFQFSFINQTGYISDMKDNIKISDKDDGFNEIREEYSDMLQNQLAKGNNGIVKTKYLSFGIEAKNLKEAIPRLERIESDIINNFAILGVKAESLNGLERLDLLWRIMNQGNKNKLKFDWSAVNSGGMTTKDYIAPTSFNFKSSKYFKMGSVFGASSFLMIIAPEISDKMLAELLDIEEDLVINIHAQSIDQREIIKEVKRKISDLDKMKIEEQKKAVRAGYDMDIIPPDLADATQEAKFLLNELQGRNERFFKVSFQITNFAPTIQKLENVIFQVNGIVQKYNCSLNRLDYQQEQGFCSSLPICRNEIELERGLPTSALAAFIPFTTQELFHGGKSLYYGLNAISNNMIMVDRTSLNNPNGLILGTPGSGKSFAAKREMANSFLITDNDIMICDPEAEYLDLSRALGGTVVNISSTSKDYINPLDINVNYGDGDDPVMLKASFVLSLMELIKGGTQGLQSVEISVIDRCTRAIYQNYIEHPKKENIPILEDLYSELLKQPELESKRLATALEIYVNGSLKVFNNRTNVDTTNRVICFNIKELQGHLKKIGMLIIQDQVWNRVSTNRSTSKKTSFYQDEFHLLLREKQTAEYSVEIWKRFRKWGGIPTGITQNIKDLLASKEIENIFENSDFVLMLNQGSGDREILAQTLKISRDQLSYITNRGPGEGLIYYGGIIIPFIDKFPKDTKLYKLMTTKPDEIVLG
ncbi:conjugal transfer protein TraE [Peptoniphilus sp. GNH]|nr:conjugal transfer protein TraE [Peptoniphilus sp. GNH]